MDERVLPKPGSSVNFRPMDRVLITGITGFVGSHLAEFLLKDGASEVHGTVRPRSRYDNIAHLTSRVRLHEFDMKDAASALSLIASLKPDHIYHLAAHSFVQSSWNSPAETIQNNTVGQVNLFEAVRKEGALGCRILVAGSSEEYGLVLPDEVPIRETNPLRPLSPYAVSKVGQDLLAYQYHRSYGIHAVRCRAFNHTGPRRGEVFVTSNFCRQFAMMAKGLQPRVLKVGNLEAIRDFTDVRDMVRAYALAIEKCAPGDVYNIATGKGHAVSEILDALRRISGMSPAVEEDPARMRPSDVPVLIGDSSKFRAATGWIPEIPFERTIQDLYEYWLERVS